MARQRKPPKQKQRPTNLIFGDVGGVDAVEFLTEETPTGRVMRDGAASSSRGLKFKASDLAEPNHKILPEKRLLLAMIERAFLDMRSKDPQTLKEAERWLFSTCIKECEWSLRWVMLTLGWPLEMLPALQAAAIKVKTDSSFFLPTRCSDHAKNYGKYLVSA